MRQLWLALGRVIYWLAWPALAIYLPRTRRTRVAVMHEDRLLLVRTWMSSGRWGLPGGGQHRHEAAQQAAARELQEETSLRVDMQTLQPQGTHERRSDGIRTRYTLFSLKLTEAPSLKTQLVEISDLGWFTKREIETMHVAPEVHQAAADWL